MSVPACVLSNASRAFGLMDARSFIQPMVVPYPPHFMPAPTESRFNSCVGVVFVPRAVRKFIVGENVVPYWSRVVVPLTLPDQMPALVVPIPTPNASGGANPVSHKGMPVLFENRSTRSAFPATHFRVAATPYAPERFELKSQPSSQTCGAVSRTSTS